MKYNIIKFPVLNSTQNYAKMLASRGEKEGTVVVSDVQTRGKGRLGRFWISPVGGLWASLILRPKFSVKELAPLNLLIGLTICKVLREVSKLDILLKWPNDIIIPENGYFKKIGGVISEASTQLDLLQWVIIGMGINVNNPTSEELKEIAVSLKEKTKKNYDLNKILKIILSQWDKNYELYQEKGFSPFLKEYKNLSFLIGKRIKVIMGNQEIEGKVKDVNEEGLVLSTLKGEKTITAGDLILIIERNKK